MELASENRPVLFSSSFSIRCFFFCFLIFCCTSPLILVRNFIMELTSSDDCTILENYDFYNNDTSAILMIFSEVLKDSKNT